MEVRDRSTCAAPPRFPADLAELVATLLQAAPGTQVRQSARAAAPPEKGKDRGGPAQAGTAVRLKGESQVILLHQLVLSRRLRDLWFLLRTTLAPGRPEVVVAAVVVPSNAHQTIPTRDLAAEEVVPVDVAEQVAMRGAGGAQVSRFCFLRRTCR